MVRIEEAVGAGRGIGNTVLTLTTRNEHDRTEGSVWGIRVVWRPVLFQDIEYRCLETSQVVSTPYRNTMRPAVVRRRP